MPKRMMPSGETNVFNAPRFEAAKERTNSIRKRLIGGLAVVGVSLGMGVASVETGAAVANADEQVFVGGNCDPGSGYVSQFYRDNGMANPNARQVNINYPASIGPVCGPTPMRESVNIGADQIMNEYLNNAPGEQFYVEGFSLGAAVADEFANRITDRGARPLPQNVHVIGSGDGYGATGILNHPLAPLARIVTDPMGIPAGPELRPVPGQLIRFDINDLWGDGGAQGFDIGALIGMVSRIGQDHRIPNPNEPHQTFVHNGVTYEVYGIERGDGISRAIVEAGGDPTDIGRWFFGILDGPQNPANNANYNNGVVPQGVSRISTNVQTLTTPHNMVIDNGANESAPVSSAQNTRSGNFVQPQTTAAVSHPEQKKTAVTRKESVVRTGRATVRSNVEIVARPTTLAGHGQGNKQR